MISKAPLHLNQGKEIQADPKGPKSNPNTSIMLTVISKTNLNPCLQSIPTITEIKMKCPIL